jgi:predicted secreted protein
MAGIEFKAVDHGREIEVVEGDRLTIHLDENLSTGYAWEIVKFDDGLFEVITNRHLPGPPGIGRGGLREVILEAVEVGAGRIALRLRRAWDPPEVEAERFEVQVRIGQCLQ